MKLSVCLMVRDEEANLPRALDSVRDVADEILVIDTGSVDSTVAIAESRGARVLHYKWEDDFSAPHNFGWEQARGDWLLWLDADESLVQSSIPHLQNCVQRTDVGGFYILRQEILDSDQPGSYTEMMMLRLHRRDLPARFIGRYHTQIVAPSSNDAPQFRWVAARAGVRLQHWRYKADEMLRARRAARILAQELEDEPDNLYVMIELANSYRDLGDPRAVELRRQIAAKLRPQDESPPTIAVVYTLDHLINHPAEAAAAGFSFLQVHSLCMRWFPYSAPLRWAIAQHFFKAGHFERAAAELAELIRLIRSDELDKLVPFDPRVEEDAAFNLAVCLTRLARLDEAEAIFKHFFQSSIRADAARANLEVIAQLRKIEADAREGDETSG